MWQRIQTLYMILGAAISMIVALLFPFYITMQGAVMPLDNPVILFLFGFITGALIANVFNFKKRSLQIVLNRLVLVANVILIAFMAWDLSQHWGEGSKLGVSLFVPFVTMIFIFLANKGIAKDEKIIRSADRIR